MTKNNRKTLFFFLTNVIITFVRAQSFSIGGYTDYEVTDNSKITFTIHRHKWQAVTFSYKDTLGIKLYIFVGNTKTEVYPTYKKL
jgi:hypothetical protein